MIRAFTEGVRDNASRNTAGDLMNMRTNGTGIDPLTGLNDRSALPGLSRQFSAREHPWSLVMLDIDHFKLVNDIYGHLAGDDLLSHVGQTIRYNLKRGDQALRFGGDEFIVILPDTSGDNALDLAQRLLFELRKREFPGGLKVSVSMGIAQSKSDDADLSNLISMADQALYHAKETGRGRFVLADDLEFLKNVEPDFSHMVGRRDELHQLRELVNEAIEDSARFCLLTGFIGTGKTKLLEELLNYSQFKSIPTFTTESHPVFQEYSFLVINTIRKALEHLTENQLYNLKNTVKAVEHSTAEQLSEFSFTAKQRTVAATPEEEKARYRRDLGLILKEISRITPFSIVLDNLHWASARSIQFASEVISTVPDANILYIAVSRNQNIFRYLKPVWTSVPSKRIHLEPLTQPDVRTMVFFAMKTPAIPDEVQNYLMRQSGGNALFLRKLISWGLKLGYLSVGKGEVCVWKEPEEEELPGDITPVIEIMLESCSEDELAILKRAALAGELLDLKLLCELTSKDEYTLAETLDRLVDLGLLKDDGRRYTFSYGVMKSLLISRISPSLRQLLHEKTASFLASGKYPEENSVITETARHFCNSRNNDKALEYAEKAARATFARGLHSDSIHWYLEYLNRVSPDTADPETYLKAHINTGILYSITGKADLAEKYLVKAISLASDPMDMCAIYHRLGRNYKRKSDYPSALHYFNKTISVGNEASELNGFCINNMAGALLETSFINLLQNKQNDARENLKTVRELLDRHTDGIDKSLEGMYFARLADIETETGSWKTALEEYEKALEICVREKDTQGEALILNNMHDLYTQSGDYNTMLNSLKQTIKLNGQLGDQLGLAIGYYNLAETYTHLNMLDLAKRYFQMYIELNSRIENRLGMAYGQLGLGKLAMVKSRGSRAAEYFLNASQIFGELSCIEMQQSAELNMAKAHLAMGDYRKSREILADIRDEDSSTSNRSLLMHLQGVLLGLTKDDPESTHRATEMIKQSITMVENASPDEIVFMHWNLFRALEKEDRHEEAIDVLRETLDLLQSNLSRIESQSIRKSILSRSDLESFFEVCRERGIASPLLNS